MKWAWKQLAAVGLMVTAFPLRAQIPVHGQVLDRLGSPSVGTRVELLPILTSYEQGLLRLQGRGPTAVAAAETDAQGRFRLTADKPGLLAVRLSAAGRIPLTFEPLPLVEDTELPPVTLPEDAGAPLGVRDETGRPAAEVWVFAEGDGNATLPSGWRIAPRVGRTAADGSLAVPRLASEKLRVHVFFGAGREQVQEGFSGGDLRLGTAVAPESRLRVVDAQGRPVAGVLVRLGETAWPAGLTADDGRLTIGSRGDSGLRVRLETADGRRFATRLAGRGEETLVLDDTSLHTGRVRQDENGRPLVGALVWPGADPGIFSVTDAEGRYQVPALQGAALWVEAKAPGRLPQRLSFEALRSDTGRAPAFHLKRAGEIIGKIVTGTGAPISGAWVGTLPPTGGAATGADGTFRLGRAQPGGRYFVHAAKPGFLPATAEKPVAISASRPASIVLILSPNRPATGRILDTNGRPVMGAEVRLMAARERTGPPAEPTNAVSDGRGRFSVAALPAPALDIEVHRLGFARGQVRNFKVPPGTGPLDLGTIALRTGAALAGVVIDSAGRPLPGASIFQVAELRPPSELADHLREETPSATTGANGRFSLADQPRGVPMHLLVSARGFLPVTVRGVRPPTAAPLRIRLEPAVRLIGRVVDPEKRPVAGASIGFLWRATAPGRDDVLVGPPVVRSATARHDGRFELTDLPAGRGKLAVSAPGFVAVDGIETAVPQAAGEEEIVVLERGSILQGRVSTTAGEPVAGVRVIAGPASSVSDAEGVFRTDGVPSGTLVVEALHPHYRQYRRRMQIEEGVINRLNVVFEAGSVVRGRVVDAASKPVAGATAFLEAERGVAYRASTGEDGAFTLEPVRAGRYRLRATTYGYVEAGEPQPVIVGPEAVEGLEVVLAAGGTISGRILGLGNDDLAQATVRADHESGDTRLAEVDAAGHYFLRDLRAGGWLVQASLHEGQRHARARVLLAPGGEETRDLKFGGNLTLSGRVLYDDKPVADATISIRGHRLAIERSSATDYEGSFRFEDLDADTYWLGLNQTNELLVHNETITLAADRDITIRLERETISGTVLDATNEEPVAGAIVSLRHIAGDDGPEFVIADGTDLSGAFRFDRVPPGNYVMRVNHDGYAGAERTIDVAQGSGLQDLEVPLQPASGADLLVRKASGGTPAMLHLRVLSPSGSTVLTESRPVGSGGKVRLSSVPAGSWTLLAASADGALSAVPLTIPSEPTAVVLPDAAQLTIRVPSLAVSDALGIVSLLGADGHALQTLGPGGMLQQSWSLVAGRAAIDGVPAGSWLVSVAGPDGRTWSKGVTTDGRTNKQVDLE